MTLKHTLYALPRESDIWSLSDIPVIFADLFLTFFKNLITFIYFVCVLWCTCGGQRVAPVGSLLLPCGLHGPTQVIHFSSNLFFCLVLRWTYSQNGP